MYEQFNRFVNLLKKEEESTEEKYPWLDENDEKKYMTDREILDTSINLDNSCLTKAEKKEVRDLLYEYKDTFSLRDEIGICPEIDIEIDVTDKTPFFIRPVHAKEKDKVILDKEMEGLCYLGILKESVLAYSSPVLLIRDTLLYTRSVPIFPRSIPGQVTPATYLALGSICYLTETN